MRFYAIAVAICVAATIAVGAPKKPPPKPPPPSPEKVRADKLFEDGRRYLSAKEYALACTAFEQSHQADPAIGTQLNIALCYEEWGKTAAAYRAYLEAERLAQLKGDERTKGARQKIDELAPKVPHLTVSVPADADASTVYLIDGKELSKLDFADDQLLDPGEHVIEARVPGKAPKLTKLVMLAGQKRKIMVDVPRPDVKIVVVQTPRKKGRLYGGIALTAGGGITIGVASFVALVARQDYAKAVADCPEHVCLTREAFDTTQDARNKATLMTFVGTGGLALAGAGVYLILTSKGARTEKKLTLAPVVGAGLGLAIGGRL